MLQNFERLMHIHCADDWKNEFSKWIILLDQLYQEEEERLFYVLYSKGVQDPKIEEINKLKHELMTNERLKSVLLYWQERVERLCGEYFTFKHLAETLAKKVEI